MPSPPSSARGRHVPDERLDREVERPLERQPGRERLRPVRHQRQRQQPARRAAARRGTRPGRSRRRASSRRSPSRARTGSSSGSRTRPRSRRGTRRPRARSGASAGWKTSESADRDRQVQDEPRDLLAGERREVVVDRVQRPQQLAGELALADPPLPAERREDDVHHRGRASRRCSTRRTRRRVMPSTEPPCVRAIVVQTTR